MSGLGYDAAAASAAFDDDARRCAEEDGELAPPPAQRRASPERWQPDDSADERRGGGARHEKRRRSASRERRRGGGGYDDRRPRDLGEARGGGSAMPSSSWEAGGSRRHDWARSRSRSRDRHRRGRDEPSDAGDSPRRRRRRRRRSSSSSSSSSSKSMSRSRRGARTGSAPQGGADDGTTSASSMSAAPLTVAPRWAVGDGADQPRPSHRTHASAPLSPSSSELPPPPPPPSSWPSSQQQQRGGPQSATATATARRGDSHDREHAGGGHGDPRGWLTAGGGGAWGAAPSNPRHRPEAAAGTATAGAAGIAARGSSGTGGGVIDRAEPARSGAAAAPPPLPRGGMWGGGAAARSRLPALLREAVDTAACAIIQRGRLEDAEGEAARAAADAAAVAAPARRRFFDDDGDGGGAPPLVVATRSPRSAPPADSGSGGRALLQQPHPSLQPQSQPQPPPSASPSSAFSGDAFAATPTAAAAAAAAASAAHASVSDASVHPPAHPPPAGAAWNSFLSGCRSVSAYRPLGKIDEGTYGEVFAAVDVETGAPYALKKVKMAAVTANEGFPITALRESHLLLALGGAGPRAHPNIVAVREMVVGSTLDKVYMVMELLEHDLKAVFAAMAGCFTQAEVKCLLRQLLEGVCALHTAWVCHRDLKPSNLLCDNAGRLAICDFGMARHFGSPPKAYTQPVVTLWYRAPELLLGQRVYDGAAVDMFSVGCIFAELLTRRPLFRTQGGSEAEMLGLVFGLLGTPTEATWPGWGSLPGASGLRLKHRPPQSLRSALGMVGGGGGFGGTTSISDAGLELLRGLLALDPAQRTTAPEALAHRWFAESPPPCDPALMPSFPSSSELKVAKQRARGSARSPQPHAAAAT